MVGKRTCRVDGVGNLHILPGSVPACNSLIFRIFHPIPANYTNLHNCTVKAQIFFTKGLDMYCLAVTIQPESKRRMAQLHFQIDPHSGLPVYRQMMDQVKYYIAAGTLRAGDLLPSIRELAQSLAVNPTTVVKAYSELEHAGVIEMRHGKGAFVSDGASALSEREREKALRRLARQLAVEATQMGADGKLVARVVQEELAALRETEQ